MLEIRNLEKFYKTKTEIVHALNKVNLHFPDKGFIVILGKSGCGKSTLLNIIGGLDNFDRGEIIIKGSSTKNFQNNEWDCYRNRYVGNIFQEFYLIDEVSIGKNIALSLELQGVSKEKIDKKVDDILKLVDLEGYKDRKTNAISGGQKQRIAIARALVKDPEIILADEPTGNLDSETGRIILETLHRISRSKLVIMVTHDKEYAKEYANRIIELKDGVIIKDYSNEQKGTKEFIYNGKKGIKKIIKCSKGNKLSQSTINYINELLLKNKEKLFISLMKREQDVEELIVVSKDEEINLDTTEMPQTSVEGMHLKKTHLPFSYAIKLAINSIFKKKLRLIFMSFLFIFSLIFMGIALNLSFHNGAQSSINTFNNANLDIIPIKKIKTYKDPAYNSINDYEASFTDDDIASLRNDYKEIKFLVSDYRDIPITDLINVENIVYNENYYSDQFNKLTIIDELESFFKLSEGNYPQNNEVNITDYMAEVFIKNQVYPNIHTVSDLVGKELNYNNFTVRISGIIKTDYDKYDYLKDSYNTDKLYRTGFISNRENNYLQLYMTKESYELIFYESKIDKILYFTFDLSERIWVRSTISMLNVNYNDYLIGTLPKNDDEIVIKLSTLIDELNIPLDFTDTDQLLNYLGTAVDISYYDSYAPFNDRLNTNNYKIVGIINDNQNQEIPVTIMFTNQEFLKLAAHHDYSPGLKVTAYLGDNNSQNAKFIRDLYQLHYEHDTKYSHNLYSIEENVNILKNLLFITAAVFVVFASLLIFTFMSTSIHHKQSEIGTLRAIGARGIDVAKIFVTEGIIIALVSSLISTIGVIVLINVLNDFFVEKFHLNIVLLYTDSLSIIFIFALALLIVFMSTIIPIRKLTLLKPINVIKGLK